MIKIVNIKTYKKQPGETLFKIDRTSPIGNPFFMHDESERNLVCDKYEKYFKQVILDNQKALDYLQKILNAALIGDVVLACWCVPKRCHGETILKWLNHMLNNL